MQQDSTILQNCQILDEKDSDGTPVVICDYVPGDYDEWVANLGKPFESRGGCELS